MRGTVSSLCLLLLCIGISVTYVLSLYAWQLLGFPPTADRNSPAVIVQRSASVTAVSIAAALAVEISRRSGLVSAQCDASAYSFFAILKEKTCALQLLCMMCHGSQNLQNAAIR